MIVTLHPFDLILTDSGFPHLMEAQVSLIDTADCNSSIAYNSRISQDMLCARETEAVADYMCHVRQTTRSSLIE